MQSSPSCPNCTRNFRGLQGQGQHDKSHDRGGLLPMLLRCGHTFCSGCVTKLVKLQKTNITCPQCQVNTSMPLGEASLKSLPPDYYRLGQVMSNYKQLNDLIQQKMDSSAKPAMDRKGFDGKVLQACPGRELCEECRRALSTCSCRQCGNATMCNNCFEMVHSGTKMMQSHIKRPFTKDRSIAKCRDHGEEEKYFCTQDDIAICGHCAIIGDHKGHNIEPLTEQSKEAFNELPTALDKGVASLKELYHSRQAIHKAKSVARRETGTILKSVSSTFATQIALLQMRAHHILELVHNNCTDQLDRLCDMEANISSNIAVLEGTIEEASHVIKTENDTDGNLLRMVEILTSKELPCYFHNPEGRPPMAAFTYDKDFSARILNFGSVGVDSSPRGDLLSETELPEDFENDEIKDEILKQSAAFTIDSKGALKIKALAVEPESHPPRRPVTPENHQRHPITKHKTQSHSAPASRRASSGSSSSTGKNTPPRSRGTTPPTTGNRRPNYGVMADHKIVWAPSATDSSVFLPSNDWLLQDDAVGDPMSEYYSNKITEEERKEKERAERESSRAKSAQSRGYAANRAYERASNLEPRRTAFQPETKALVRMVHIRNPCYFFVQREADQMDLGNIMTRVNLDCNKLRDHERMPETVEPGLMCCAKYSDNKWYRARIKRFIETPAKKPHHHKDAKKKGDDTKKKEENAKKKGKDAEKEDARKDADESTEKGSAKDEDASEKNPKPAADAKPKDKSEDEEVDVESVTSSQSAKSSQSVKSANGSKSSPSEPVPISERQVEVIYVDFGNTEVVTVSKLCKLKTKHQRSPEMAVCCSLVDIVPNNFEGKWTPEVNQGFAKMVGGTVVQMSVQASAGALLYVDLHKLPNKEVENDMPVSLRDALVFFELACFKSPESMPKDAWRQGCTYLGADLPKSGESINATISHINNPGSFYVQELGDDLEYLLDMMKDLQDQYQKRQQDKWGILCPQVGMICVAKFELDSQWYRAQIIGLPGKQLVGLVYVDYGNLDTVHVSNIRKVTNHFLKLPVQALPCTLADVEPLDNPANGWPQEAATAFFELVAKKTLKVIVKSTKDGCLSVVLLYVDEDDDEKELCANAELVRGDHANSKGPSSTVLPFGVMQSDASSPKRSKKQTTNGAIPSSPAKSKASPARKQATKQSVAETSKTKTPTKSAAYTKVHVSHIESPACIYVQLASAGKDGLDSLLESMTLHYKDSEQEDSVWQEGDICCALLVRENVWCRAKIKTVLPEDNAVVLFTDYGNTEIIDLINVRPLEERFQQAPPFAIQCHLADVIPAGDKHKWTKTACEFLIAKLSDLECCIVKKGELVAGSLPIDLLYEMSIEEKLERETTEDLFSISKLLKQKGLAFAPRKPRAKGHARSLSPKGKKPQAKTSPKAAIKTAAPKSMPETAPETIKEKQEDVDGGEGKQNVEAGPTTVKQEIQVVEGSSAQPAQIILENNGREEKKTDGPSDEMAKGKDTKATQENQQENNTSSQPDAVSLEEEIVAIPEESSDASQSASVSNANDIPVAEHPIVSAVKKMDPAAQPLPDSGDSDSDIVSDSGLIGDGQQIPSKLAEAEEEELTETEDFEGHRQSPPVVVLDSSTGTEVKGYMSRPLPSAPVVQLVVTYVNMEGVIFGVEVDEVESLQKLTTKLQAEMAARPPSDDVSFYKGQPVCANFTQDGLWYRAKVLGGTQQGVKVQYIDFGNIETAAPEKIQPIAFEPYIPQKTQGCKLVDLYPKEPDTSWPKETIDILLSTLLEQTCTVEIKGLCVEGKPWKVDLKLPNGDSLRQLLLDHDYAQEGGKSPSSVEEDSVEETGEEDSSSAVSSGVVSSDAAGDPRQIAAQDVVPDEEDKDDGDVDLRKYFLAGTGIDYKNMRLPDAGVYFGAQVTQVDQPDLLYIQIVPSPAGNSDPNVHRSAEELYILGELVKELNKMAPQLPRLETASMKPGQVCCALYDLDLQYYRGKIIRVRDQGEKLVQVQYIDYGNSDWHSPDSLRQIPDKFTSLPAQARKCRIVGIKPPKEIPEGDSLLLDTDWPVTSGKRMVDLVNNKQLVGIVKYNAHIPGIQLFDSASDIPTPDPQPADGMPLHVRLVSDGLAEMDSDEDDAANGQNQGTEV